MKKYILLLIGFCLFGGQAIFAQDNLSLEDVFELEYTSDPQISPDGKMVVYVRNSMDIMTDRKKTRLWKINTDGSDHRPLNQSDQSESSPRWSPDGKKLIYSSGGQIHIRWMDNGQTTSLTHLQQGPGNLTWSPDGEWIAFTSFVPKLAKPFVSLPAKPKGAKWAPPAKYIDKMLYRGDGAGYLKDGFSHIFILPVEGGTPKQLTEGDFNHGGPLRFSSDGDYLLFSANRHDDNKTEPNNSEIYELSLATNEIKTLTSRKGPDRNPAISPDGKKIAYLGFDDTYQGYQVTKLYVMNRDGSKPRLISGKLDRDVESPVWNADGKSLTIKYNDFGRTQLATISLKGEVNNLINDIGGTSIGRPYSSGSFSINQKGDFAYTASVPDRPADITVGNLNGDTYQTITRLNADLFNNRKVAQAEEIWYESSHDQRKVQGWIVYPPDFDENKKYPLILEIHGGPFANYGYRFSMEAQLYAAAGYVVLYTNPRGSTGYGQEFGNLIHHNYPGEDYDDLMSGVDAVIEKGFIDENRLFVTGGSGGGVLSSWIVGKTDRFAAAVVAKPVINWYSFALTADGYNFFYKYWFPGKPWDHTEHYMKRSPISLVGNVTTPTMLLTGESDYRTPISETEQYYQALKLQGVESAMVRIPEAGHGITARPSNLMKKVAYILAWFEKYDSK